MSINIIILIVILVLLFFIDKYIYKITNDKKLLFNTIITEMISILILLLSQSYILLFMSCGGFLISILLIWKINRIFSFKQIIILILLGFIIGFIIFHILNTHKLINEYTIDLKDKYYKTEIYNNDKIITFDNKKYRISNLIYEEGNCLKLKIKTYKETITKENNNTYTLIVGNELKNLPFSIRKTSYKQKYCTNCGNKIKGTKYCTYCGKKLNERIK